MSFYGSIYYQAAEAFAQFFIKNTGVANTNFITPNASDELLIEADGRKGRFYFDSGNQWIHLSGDPNTNIGKIWHGRPDPDGKNFVSLMNSVDGSNPAINDNATVLDLTQDIFLATPKVYYDDAGHIINGNEIEYFKIPQIAIQSSFDLLESVTVGEDAASNYYNNHDTSMNDRLTSLDNPDNGSVIQLLAANDTNQSAIGAIQTELATTVGLRTDLTDSQDITLCNSIGKIDDMRNMFASNCTVVQALSILKDMIDDQAQTINAQTTLIGDLLDRIKKLEGA